jgi:hypothetical protein
LLVLIINIIMGGINLFNSIGEFEPRVDWVLEIPLDTLWYLSGKASTFTNHQLVYFNIKWRSINSFELESYFSWAKKATLLSKLEC